MEPDMGGSAEDAARTLAGDAALAVSTTVALAADARVAPTSAVDDDRGSELAAV